MLRQVMRLSLAVVALVALSGCAIENLTGPQVNVTDRNAERLTPRREDDPRDPPAEVRIADSVPAASDTLRAGGDQN